MSTNNLTKAQRAVIVVLQEQRPYPPTVREIAAALGCTPSNVHAHLTVLRKKGMVQWEDKKPRTIQVVGKH